MTLNKFMGAAVVRAALLSLGLILWAVGPAQAFTVYAKTLTGDPVALEVQSSDTIASVKAQIETAKGFASARQRLIFAGQLLADANTLAFYNIQPGTTLHLVVTRGVPTVTAISPATGTVAGGTSVTITGTDLTDASSVTIGGIPVASYTVVSDIVIMATTPAGAAGTASVGVTTVGGSSTANSLFTYVSASSASPSIDPNVRGLLVAQVAATVRTARQATDTVQRRLEILHGDDTAAFSNGLASRLHVWTAGTIIFGDQSLGGQAHPNRFTASDLVAGVDTEVEHGLKAGLAASLSVDRTKINNDSASNNAMGLAGTAYVSWQVAPGVYLDSLAGYGHLDFSTQRDDAQALSRLAGNRSGSVLFASMLASLEQQWGAVSLAPYGGVEIVHGRLNGYTETGNAEAALRFAPATLNAQGLVLGLRGQYDLPLSWGMLSPMARLQYRHGLSGSVTQSMAYAAAPTTNYALSLPGTERNSLATSLGLRATALSGLSAQLDYLATASMNGRQSDGLRATVAIPF